MNRPRLRTICDDNGTRDLIQNVFLKILRLQTFLSKYVCTIKV